MVGNSGDDRDTKFEFGNNFFIHRERDNGTRDLFFGNTDDGGNKGHAVIDLFGNPTFIREPGGRIICDDRFDPFRQ